MKIQRYVNGRAVTQGELATLAVATPALRFAVAEADRRSSEESALPPPFGGADEAERPYDGVVC